MQGKRGKPLMVELSNCFAISVRKTNACYISFQSQLQVSGMYLNTDMITLEVSTIPGIFTIVTTDVEFLTCHIRK